MGIVYKAIDLQLNRAVAVKALEDRRLLLPGAASRLRAEALAAASLDHPYVCKVYELAETPTDTFMVMEFVEGETLASLLKRGVPPLLQTLHFAREIAEGLAGAHARGLVHRDVKPANVMVMPNGHVKLLDFGVAGVDVESTPADATRTQLQLPTRLHAGTPHYMAPEQASGDRVTTRADLFSFGVLLYECLTGSLPFSGSTTFDYVRHVMQSAPKRLDRVAPQTPAVLVDLVERCLEKAPADRPASADEIVVQIRQLIDGLTSPGAVIRTAGQAKSGRRWMLVAAAAVAIAAVAVAWRFVWTSDAEPAIWQLRPFITTSAVESGSRISPDAQWLSFIASAGGVSRIMVQRLDGGESRPLTLGPGQPQSQLWSPDGTQIAALMQIDSAYVLQIYPAFFGGAPVQSVTVGSPQERIQSVELIRWIGRDIYVRVDAASPQAALLVRRVPLDSPSQASVINAGWKLDGSLRSVDIHPGGRTAVITVSRNGREDLWTLNLDGSALRQLTDDEFFDKRPLWLGTGDRIVFQSNRGGQIDLWQIDARTGALSTLTTSETEELAESTSADGRTVSLQQLTKDANLWLFTGGGAQQLTQDSLSDYSPVLSGDGRVVAFQRSQPTPSRGYTILDAKVFVSQFDGRPVVDARPIADGFAPDLSSNGQWLAYMQISSVPARMSLSVRDLRAGGTFNVSKTAGLPSLALSPVDWATRLTAWSLKGADLFFVDVDEHDAYVLRRYQPGQPAPGKALMTAPDTLRAVTVRDLHVSPETGRLGFVMTSRDGVSVHDVDPDTNAVRQIAALAKDDRGQGVVGRGWLDRRFVLVRTVRSNEDRTQELDVLVTDDRGGTKLAGHITRAYASTTHLAGRMLYVTRSEQGTHNVFAFSLDTGQLAAITQNGLPGVTYSGFEPAGARGIIGVREERRDDISLIQQVTTSRPGNQAGR